MADDNYDKSALIQAVQSRPCLYDKKHPEYKEPKPGTWDAVAKEVAGLTGAVHASSRWRSLRDIYVRERKKFKNVPSGSSAEAAELREDPQLFRKYTRMRIETFDNLLALVEPKLRKRSFREAITPEERLILCLRFLATGDSFRSLSFNFFIGESTVGKICHEVCQALSEVLSPIYLRTPDTEEEWLSIADGFAKRWDMPNCLGAVDGKHIRIKTPAHSGSLYFNYKKYFSTVILAVADWRHKIVYLSVGSYGHESDAGIFERCDLAAALDSAANPLNLPADAPLPGTNIIVPHFFIGDGAFPLKPRMMKPFGQTNLTREKQIYNYRISRARRVVESAFGIMTLRWRLLLRAMETSVEHSDAIVYAIACLHNFLIEENEPYYQLNDGDGEVAALPQAQFRNRRANRAVNTAHAMQNTLVTYFNGIGAVDFQDEAIN